VTGGVILAYVKNQKKDDKAIKQTSETCKQKMSEMWKEMVALWSKFDWLSEIVTDMSNGYDQLNKQSQNVK
jgi:uncharacterized membrane-anchored protein YhcB (DUF1043 family)